MAATRSQTATYLLGQPLNDFDVLKVYFFHHKTNNLPQKSAMKLVIAKIFEIWSKARIPVSEERSVVRKLEASLTKYRNVCRNKKRRGDAQVAKETEFVNIISTLFDISHHNALNLIKIDEDKTFLIDQRSQRKYVIGGMDTELAEKEEKASFRIKKGRNQKTCSH